MWCIFVEKVFVFIMGDDFALDKRGIKEVFKQCTQFMSDGPY